MGSCVQPCTVVSDAPIFAMVPETTRPAGGGTGLRSGGGGKGTLATGPAEDAGACGAAGAPPHAAAPITANSARLAGRDRAMERGIIFCPTAYASAFGNLASGGQVL